MQNARRKMVYTTGGLLMGVPTMNSAKPPVPNYRPLLFALAVVFAAATILYSAAWMYYVRQGLPVELGINTTPNPTAIQITSVYNDSPAQRAGLRLNDRIVAIDGISAASTTSDSSHHNLLHDVWIKARPGDPVVLEIQRAGVPGTLTVHAVFRAAVGTPESASLASKLADQIVGSYPVLFLVVGLVVLFLRIEDRNAWLLGLVFATFIATSDMPDGFGLASAPFRFFLYSYRTIFNSLLAGLFFFFFAVFPTRSPIDRKVPWLKWVLLVVDLCLGLGGVRTGELDVLPFLSPFASRHTWSNVRIVVGYGAVILGVISLLLNLLTASSADDKRRLKVIFWGTLVGVTPAVLIRLVVDLYGFRIPFWLNFVEVIFLFLFPLAFAYSVVKHRVLEIPVLLKRSARYFIVERGFVFLILVVSVGATFWLAQVFSLHFPAGSRAAIPVGATFGVLLISGGTQVHRRVRTRLDRAFFRSSYNAQQILENLADTILTVSNREGLATLLRQHIQEALHPQSTYVYLDGGHGQLLAYAGAPSTEAMPVLRDDEGLTELQESNKPLLLDRDEIDGTQWATLGAECLVPIRGTSEGQLQGVAALGPRLSEEPYSTSDRRLLASVANQAGIAMRSIVLAERMAESMEVERRTKQEMQIARQVQSRLLPQQSPSLRTLDCAGQCIQTREVGGDYYDFLDFGSGRLGLVLADISGKGMSSALLMANLQANLRSQYALALQDIPALLRSVNRLFFKNSEASHYATMFFAMYDDDTQRLRYVNCGHNPPFLLRRGGCVERLPATATVLGMFEEWDCSVNEVQISDGDLLVIYTDGISEASPDDDKEFGEDRLTDLLRANQQHSAEQVLTAVISDVQHFSQGHQVDDMTLIVARSR